MRVFTITLAMIPLKGSCTPSVYGEGEVLRMMHSGESGLTCDPVAIAQELRHKDPLTIVSSGFRQPFSAEDSIYRYQNIPDSTPTAQEAPQAIGCAVMHKANR